MQSIKTTSNMRTTLVYILNLLNLWFLAK